MIRKLLGIGLLGLGLTGCYYNGDPLHQDRPGGSDYRPGASRWDRQDEYARRGGFDDVRRGDEREFCYRYPEQCRR